MISTLISVILPTYNSSKTIERCIDSIYNQEGLGTLFNFEIIIIDDCSSDDTILILTKYPDLRVLSNEINSGGPNKGRNIGLKKSSGDWIVFVDHDDEWCQNRIINQINYSNFNIITCGFDVYLNNKYLKSLVNFNLKGYIEYERNLTFTEKLKRNPNSQITYFGTFLFKSVLKNILLEETFGKCDFDYILRLFHNQSTVELSIPLIKRYVESSNLSLNENYRLQDFEIAMKSFKEFSKKYPYEVKIGQKRMNAALGRYYFSMNNGFKARIFLKKSRLGFFNVFLIFFSFISTKVVNKYIRLFD